MGILDDAIREHLELKRRHGAGDDDLDRLEKEAFGPPTRPGDPDFAGDSGSGADAAEAATTVAPQPETGASEPSAELARAEHPHLDDTADHPAPDQAEPDAEEPIAEAPALEEPPPLAEPLPPRDPEPDAAVPEAPESSIFDAEDFEFGDLDLDLDEEDDGTVGPQPSAGEPNPFISDDDDLSLAFEDEVPSTGESAPPPSPPRDQVLRDPAVEPDTGNPPLPVAPREDDPEDAASPPAPDEEGEDLLEETPDFLRDTPEGDRAWFEQDPPKDFDFDD